MKEIGICFVNKTAGEKVDPCGELHVDFMVPTQLLQNTMINKKRLANLGLGLGSIVFSHLPEISLKYKVRRWYLCKKQQQQNYIKAENSQGIDVSQSSCQRHILRVEEHGSKRPGQLTSSLHIPPIHL